jgi:hypothetical protein
LIMKNTVVAAMEFSRCARLPAEKTGRRAGLSKLNSVERRGRRNSRRARALDELVVPCNSSNRTSNLPE